MTDLSNSQIDPTATTTVGSTGVTITRIGFGTAPLGGLYEVVDEADAHAAVQRGLDAGLGYFDSAPHYGWGLAEERLGAALAQAGRRPAIGTKIGYGLRPSTEASHDFFGTPPLEPYVDWTEEGVQRSFEGSLERLRTDRVDILYMHDPTDGEFDDLVRVGATTARKWQDEGIVGAVGAGMNTTADAVALLERVELDAVLIAGRVSLLDQSATELLLPRCASRGTSVIVGGVYSSGILARPDVAAKYDYKPAAAELVERARQIGAICERHGVPLQAAAIQFPFRYDAVTAVIPGMRSVEEVDQNLAWCAHEIPAELWAELEAAGHIPPLDD
jgi:D-threo-aldose 1-dehydrogenase